MTQQTLAFLSRIGCRCRDILTPLTWTIDPDISLCVETTTCILSQFWQPRSWLVQTFPPDAPNISIPTMCCLIALVTSPIFPEIVEGGQTTTRVVVGPHVSLSNITTLVASISYPSESLTMDTQTLLFSQGCRIASCSISTVETCLVYPPVWTDLYALAEGCCCCSCQVGCRDPTTVLTDVVQPFVGQRLEAETLSDDCWDCCWHPWSDQSTIDCHGTLLVIVHPTISIIVHAETLGSTPDGPWSVLINRTTVDAFQIVLPPDPVIWADAGLGVRIWFGNSMIDHIAVDSTLILNVVPFTAFDAATFSILKADIGVFDEGTVGEPASSKNWS